MTKEETEIVYTAIKDFGDGFWNDIGIYSENDIPTVVSNKHLFDDIINYVKQAGYDLKLVKLET